MSGAEPGLAPDHRCRTDDLEYETVGAWYEDHRGRVPIQEAIGLSQYIKRHGCTFAEAFQALVGGGAIIFVDEDE